jgi:hypothetical protein
VDFLDAQGRAFLCYGYPFRWLAGAESVTDYGAAVEVTHSHIEHAQRLIPGWELANAFSGMQHHQLVDRDILEAMLVEAEQARGRPFWQCFVDAVEPMKWNGASEYVLYFHYALTRYARRVLARHLYGLDIIHDADEPIAGDRKGISLGQRPDIIGCHGFTSLRKRLETMDYIPDDVRQQLLSGTNSRLAARLELRDGIVRVEAWSERS